MSNDTAVALYGLILAIMGFIMGLIVGVLL